jgi:gamma-glutamyltranspeptidase/glutathione hydrolase
MVRLIDHAQNPQACIDAPRWRVDPDHIVDVERHAAPDMRAALEARGHRLAEKVDEYDVFGAGQFIYKVDGGYVAASDSRRDGQAVGC